jgi:hypothetical protein
MGQTISLRFVINITLKRFGELQSQSRRVHQSSHSNIEFQSLATIQIG